MNDKEWIGNADWCTYQLNQCRVHIDRKCTEVFYQAAPSLTDVCDCDYCRYYQTVVIRIQDHRFFEVMRLMHIDAGKQSQDPSAEICCIGPVSSGRLGYMGTYVAYGKIGKTAKSTVVTDTTGVVYEVDFHDTEFGKGNTVKIKKLTDETIGFEFYLEVPAGITPL